MSIRNLDSLFNPSSVALIGASDRPGSVGAVLLRSLLAGGFAGPVWPVNPHHASLAGLPVFRDVPALPQAPGLAVICTPPRTIPGLVQQLGRRGTRAAIVISAGLKQPLDEARPDGPSIEQAMLDAARPHLLRILGPNCIGALVPHAHLNASFAPSQAAEGGLAFVTQSGALATAMLDWANGQGVGFSHFVSLGDSADVDFGDMLDWLGRDSRTRAILLYAESVKNARKLMSAARATARVKPVIVVKSGRAPEGARAAASHTGALAGSDDVFDAAVRRAGMLRVDTLDALFDAARTLSHPHPWRGERLAILTNGGGAGVLAADALSLGGGTLATLSPQTLAALDAVLPAQWPRANPVDIIGDAPVQRYVDALRVLMAAPEVDGVLFMHAPTAIVPALDIALACVPPLREARKPVLACWLGGPAVAAATSAFRHADVPCHETPERAVAAWLQLQAWHRNQAALLQLPQAQPASLRNAPGRAQPLIEQALAEGRAWLDEGEAKSVLAAYGIPTVATEKVADADAAVAAANRLGWPVALKVVSPHVLHKSDVGGVALGLRDEGELRAAIDRMCARIAGELPQARIVGYTVQPMARRPQAHELIVGIATDPVFGPVVLFGEGGTAVELRRDRAVALPPLNARLALDLVSRTRIARMLAGYRGRPAVNEPALVDTLLRVSQLACDLPAVQELDINPLWADADGVLALDARIRVRQPTAADMARMALRPYPAELEAQVQVDGRALLLRPIRPEDGQRLARFYKAASAQDLRLRFFHSRMRVPLAEIVRFSQIDYEREMALVAWAGDELVGEARASCDPDNEVAEFAVMVAHGWQGRGIATVLMQRLLDYLRRRGTREVVGECLAENAGMQALARRLGFEVMPAAGDDLVALRLVLNRP